MNGYNTMNEVYIEFAVSKFFQKLNALPYPVLFRGLI